LLFNAKWAIDSAILWREQVIVDEMMWYSPCTRPTRLVAWTFRVLSHWNYSSRVDMLLYSDILFWLFWFRVLLLLNYVCLAISNTFYMRLFDTTGVRTYSLPHFKSEQANRRKYISHEPKLCTCRKFVGFKIWIMFFFLCFQILIQKKIFVSYILIFILMEKEMKFINNIFAIAKNTICYSAIRQGI
jgi:hypothetical protein